MRVIETKDRTVITEYENDDFKISVTGDEYDHITKAEIYEKRSGFSLTLLGDDRFKMLSDMLDEVRTDLGI